MSEFLGMGGYGLYVWGSYGLGLGVFVWNLVAPRLQRAQLVARLREELEA